MTRSNTKQSIMLEALALFAVRGFDGVSVKEIAEAAGIRDSSIYKHYRSKQDIFEAIVSEVSQRIQLAYQMISMPDVHNPAPAYELMTTDTLERLCVQMLSFYLDDPVLACFRRMLTIEQYRNTRIADLFRRFFIEEPLTYQTNLFRELIRRGVFKEGDPAQMALQFYSPLYLLLYRYDGTETGRDVITHNVRGHLDAFTRLYLKRDAGV